MKRTIIPIIIAALVFASCKKDKDFSGVTVTLKNEQITPYGDELSYYAEYTYPAKLLAVTILMSENPSMSNARTVQCDVGYMTIKATVKDLNSGTTYYYKLKYDTGYGILESEAKSFVTGEIIYSKLVLNELNGNDKFIEIYNAGAEEINLNGVFIQKDLETNWTADNTIVIPANGFVLLYSTDVACDHPEIPANYIFNSGLSAKKNVRVQLFTPAGESIDDFNLVNIDANDPSMIPAPASYSRNGDGNWFYADATPGAVNIDGMTPLLGLEGGPTPPTPPEEPDYTNLILNELNGDTKFIELYNKGNLDLHLEGMYLCKDGVEGLDNAKWVADATIVIPAHGYILLYSEDVVVPGEAQEGYPEELIFHSGLSAKKTIKYALYMPDGTETDVFIRGKTGEWGLTISSVSPLSYARTPDGGIWKLAEPTPGAANPKTGDEIPQV